MLNYNKTFTIAKVITLAFLVFSVPTNAQETEIKEFGIFDHLAAGISLGTDGIGVDLAAPITDAFAIRAGISFWPSFSHTHNFELRENDPQIKDNVDVKGTLNMFDGKLLADYYPINNSTFHITAGFFVGTSNVINAKNTSMFIKDPADYGRLGLKVGDYRITTDKQGYAKAEGKVNCFKPYLGIGFGRSIPKKNRFAVSFDMGVKFWGKPGIGANVKDDWGDTYYHKFSYSDLGPDDDEDLKDGLKFAEKIVAYPVINIRLTGRIF